MPRLTVRAAALALAFWSAGAAVQAATLSVPSPAFPTIQAALDGAAPGDRVVVAPGTYAETLTIHPGLAGLTLVGKGRVVVHAPDPGHGAGLSVHAPDVTVAGLSLTHFALGVTSVPGLASEIFAGDRADGLTLEQLTVVNARAAGIHVLGDGVRIAACHLLGNGGGLYVEGDDVVLARVAVRDDAADGMRVVGDDARIDGCLVSAVAQGTGIHVTGAGAAIQRNRIDGVDRMGIWVIGQGALLQRNVVAAAASAGFFVQGDDAWVLHNRGTAFPRGGRGVDVSGHNAHVLYNRIERVQGFGFYLRVDDSEVSGNRAERCGVGSLTGLRVSGDRNLIHGNRASDCSDTGLSVIGLGNSLIANVALHNADNGIQVQAPHGFGQALANRLERNVAVGNHGDGIEVRDAGTLMLANRALHNLQDLSSSVGPHPVGDLGGNVFVTGGFSSEPAVD